VLLLLLLLRGQSRLRMAIVLLAVGHGEARGTRSYR
jgi:hypothetical protein